MRTLLPFSVQNSPHPQPLQRGEVGWVSGAKEPLFFIFLGINTKEADKILHLKEVTKWGRIADPASIQVAMRLANSPAGEHAQPHQPQKLAQKWPFNISVMNQ